MTYDHWKTTELQSGYDPPEPNIEEEFDRVCARYEARIALLERMLHDGDRFEAALRRIVEWKGYITFDSGGDDYAHGANDMLAVLKKIAEEALG